MDLNNGVPVSLDPENSRTPSPILRDKRESEDGSGARGSLISDSNPDTSGIEPDTPGSNTASAASYSNSPDSSSGGDRSRQRAKSEESKGFDAARTVVHYASETKEGGRLHITENPSSEGVKFVGLDDDDSICSSVDGDDETDKPDIPDGGWGWMVVASSLVISMIADGISFSFGLLYIEFLEEFQASKSKTAWIGSLFIAVPLLSGPIMSALVDRYGCRSMTILGGLIATFGFVLASISHTIELMFLTFGVIAGLGLGLVYVTAVVSIAYWFDKKRTLAVGLGACGTGVGTFVYAPMTQYFLNEYGWRGTILLLSGTLLNLCVCGSIMRDPEWWVMEQKKQVQSQRKRSTNSESLSARSGGGESVFPGVEELKSLMKSGETPEYILTKMAASIHMAENLETTTKMNAELKAKTNSAVQLPTFLKQSEKVPIEVLETLSANKRLYNIILENYPSLLNFRSSSEQQLPAETPPGHKQPVTMSMKLKATTKERSFEKKDDAKIFKRERSADKKDELTIREGALENLLAIDEGEAIASTKRPTLKKQDSKGTDRREWLKKQFSINNHHYLKDIRLHRNSIMHRNAMMNISKYRLRASSCPNIYKNSMITIVEEEEKWYSEALEMVQGMFDFAMFLELHFLLMSLATILLFVWFIVPYFYLAEHMTRHEYKEEDAATLLSIIGITNTIGMVSLGWAGDQPWMNVTKTYSVCLAVCGVCTGIFPLITPYYWLMMVDSALFGLSFASTFSFTPAILVELIPLEKFTTAYGLILLCQGIGHLIGPPLSGMIFDITRHWDLSFYMAGVWIVAAGLLIAVIPLTENVRVCGSAPLEKHLERLSHKDSTSIA